MTDLTTLTSWHADWKGLRVAVLGLGMTGFAAADTLVELGATVLVVAAKAPEEHADLLGVIGAELLEVPGLDAVPPRLAEFDPELVIVSPGFHPDHAVLLWAAATGIPVWGDIELAWRVRDKVRAAEWITVTGTNGKTTTVQLATHLLAAAGHRVAAVGNIGVPVLDAVRDPIGFDVLVVELSSYQLHWINQTPEGSLSPLASVCLNLADDHLDWHGSADAYAAAKGKVYDNTRIAAVYNLADEATMHMVEEADVVEGCRAIGFGTGAPGPSDLGVVDGIIVDRAFHDDRRNSAFELTTHGELAAAGLAAPHSVSNVLAASALVRAYGVAPAVIRDALATFRIDHHRTETVLEADGVLWVDDSKATNPHAAEASLRAFERVVWVVGGLLKGVDVSRLVERQAARLAAAVIIGVDRTELREAFERHAPGLPVFEVAATDTDDVMPEVVRLSAAAARPGDTVLLAPAAASMDQFTDYGDRGRRFAAAVLDQLRSPSDSSADDSAGGAADDDHSESGHGAGEPGAPTA
ncbi:UDP-N-acetylmuramoylalanine--D-glutamate ligase [Conyzicola lurida]|uniref:UDP-N-acetylmuramoylalanine--D-glutamate ligase n=1 Tax=Conyzicola lurida TaxID=1172621 RepID=A0A841AMK4_9MICO|nr:UDP-N-acetylmuramoylalanine--D-glutamate ligase [Conyzicola lurida]